MHAADALLPKCQGGYDEGKCLEVATWTPLPFREGAGG